MFNILLAKNSLICELECHTKILFQSSFLSDTPLTSNILHPLLTSSFLAILLILSSNLGILIRRKDL